MISSTMHWNGDAPATDADAQRAVLEKLLPGLARRLVKPLPPQPRIEAAAADSRPILAVFCYEDPDSPIGQYVQQALTPLAERQIIVHVFSRKPFERLPAGMYLHPVGDAAGDDLLTQVETFTDRAINAFLQAVPADPERVALLGHEWSSVAALSVLRSIKNLPMLLSLHSLERQRSGMTSPLAPRIEEFEFMGLREARKILVHQAATAEVAKSWVPECADRLVSARVPFSIQEFDSDLDPGVVKARYQVGPVDPTILYVGDLDERYGPDILMKALPVVLKNHPQTRLVIVGDGSFLWPLRVYARYLLLDPVVRFVGHVQGQQLAELVHAADIVAVPSREATPWWPILAGWAARRPVVATHQAAPTLLEHEKDSVLFYPQENSCVWGIERVLFDTELAKALGQQGRLKLEERFGWNAVADQILELMPAHQMVK
jgi:glycosyltransferase involved in cell wall biosynthesis